MTTALAHPEAWTSPAQAPRRSDAPARQRLVVAYDHRSDQAPAARWLAPTLERMNDVGRLHDGWDGADAAAPTPTAALSALRALGEIMWHDTPAPAVVPMYDGGLQLEWHGHGLDVELTVAPDGVRHVWISAASGLEIDHDFREAVEDLRKHLGTLTHG